MLGTDKSIYIYVYIMSHMAVFFSGMTTNILSEFLASDSLAVNFANLFNTDDS